MTLRSCIFKNCGNYVDLNNRKATDVKLFSFPKNPARYLKWLELGKVRPNLPDSMYYFCSDHFDKKYFAVNNRRTILVGEAVPFPYVETETADSIGDEELDYYIYDVDKSKNADESKSDNQDLLVESTTITTELQDNYNDHFTDNVYGEDATDVIIYTGSEKDNQEYSSNYDNKRKLDDTILQIPSSKAKVLKTSGGHTLRKTFENTHLKTQRMLSRRLSTSAPDEIIQDSTEDNNGDNAEADQLVDKQHVTTFIFKGEEYVQMPKQHYINEKMQLKKELKEMTQALKAIKGHLNSLNL